MGSTWVHNDAHKCNLERGVGQNYSISISFTNLGYMLHIFAAKELRELITTSLTVTPTHVLTYTVRLRNIDTVSLSWLLTVFDTSRHLRMLRVHPLMKSISGQMSPYYNSQKQRTLADLSTAALRRFPAVVL